MSPPGLTTRSISEAILRRTSAWSTEVNTLDCNTRSNDTAGKGSLGGVACLETNPDRHLSPGSCRAIPQEVHARDALRPCTPANRLLDRAAAPAPDIEDRLLRERQKPVSREQAQGAAPPVLDAEDFPEDAHEDSP
jgi:hypothetical protein